MPRRLQENATSFSCAQFPPKTARTLDCLFVLLDFIAVSCWVRHREMVTYWNRSGLARRAASGRIRPQWKWKPAVRHEFSDQRR